MYNLQARLTLQDRYSRRLQEAKRKTQNFGRRTRDLQKNLSDLGQGFQRAGRTMTTRVTAPLTALAGASVYAASNFDDSMRRIQVVTGETGDELEKMEDLARDLGSTTAFSASQAASAMEKMGLAGWESGEILDATEDVLNLASAGQMDLTRASDIVTDSMSQFNIEADEAGRVADSFAQTSMMANTDVEQLGLGLTYVGGQANNAGMSIEETNAALAVLADAGHKGSKGGTILARVLADMQQSAEDGAIALGDHSVKLYDAEGNMRDFGNIMQDITGVTENMSDEQRNAALSNIFNQQSLKGLNELLGDGVDLYGEFTDELKNADGASKNAAETMEEGIGGAIRELKSSIEGLLIDIGDELEPVVLRAAEVLSDLARKFGELDESTRRQIVLIGGLVGVLGPLLMGVGIMINLVGTAVAGFGKLIGIFKALTKAKLLFSAALWASPITWIIAGIVALIAVGVLLWKNWDWITEKAGELWSVVTDFFGSIKDTVVDSVTYMVDVVRNFFVSMGETIVSAVGKAKDFVVWTFTEMPYVAAEKLGYMVGTAVRFLSELPGHFKDFISSAYNTAVNWISKLPGMMWNFLTDMGTRTVEFLSGLPGTFKEWFKDSFNTAVDIIKELPGKIAEFIAEIPGKVKGFISDIWDAFSDIGKTVVEAIASGFSTALDAAGRAVGWVVDTVAGGLSTIGDLGSRFGTGFQEGVSGSHYHGLDYVPRDNYLANLHRGEAVLPKQEAQDYREGGSSGKGGVNVTITGNTFNVRDEYDIEKIAKGLANQLNMKLEGGV